MIGRQFAIELVAALMVAAAANDGVRSGPRYVGLFHALDTNRDGFLDDREIDGAGDVIRKFDTNGDGDVTQRDVFHAVGHFRVPSSRPSAILFQWLDPNGDRTLDRAELLKIPALLAKLDRDRDGKIALWEVTR